MQKKDRNSYYWEYQPKGFYKIDEKFSAINQYPEIRNELNAVYLDKKRYNDDPDKKSRSLFAEAVNEVYKRNFDD